METDSYEGVYVGPDLIVIEPDLLWSDRSVDAMIHQINILNEGIKQVEEWKSKLEDDVARALGKGGAIRYGDQIYRFSQSKTEKCIDPEGFISWLESEEGAKYRRKMYNPNNAKKGVMPKAVRDTFFETQYKEERSLSAMPVDKAPKFLQKLEDQEVYRAEA